MGKALLTEAKTIARDMGAREICLDTLKSLTSAVALYRADGFVDTEAYPGAEIGEHPEILPHAMFMKRRL